MSIRLSFFTPFYVLTNLFVCVLRNPRHDRITLILSLMDLGAAFFIRLHIATDSVVCMEFARYLTELARSTVQASKSTIRGSRIASNDADGWDQSSIEVAGSLGDQQSVALNDSNEVRIRTLFRLWLMCIQCTSLDQEELDMEQWGIFIPADIDLDGIDFQSMSVPNDGATFNA